jgi:DNA polymerase-3 subunit delta
MIIKHYEIDKIDLKKNFLFLLYGENQGLKNELIKKKFYRNYSKKTYVYEESEELNNKINFFESITSQSFFENEKLIIINRASDKIIDVVEEIVEKNINDIVLLLNANSLEKKSKLRSFFEKNKQTITIPFYEDNSQTLSAIANSFFREKKIPISQQSINLLVNRCRGDRQNLNNELEKIECFILNKNKIEISELLKLTNLADNYNVSELIDSCLAKNKKKTINILNENNYSLDDCIIIIRTLLIKSKRLLKLCKDYKNKKNVNEVISNYKPTIFWKDKTVVEQQINSWTQNDAEKLIFKINEIELLIKKNSNISVSILLDFLLDQASPVNN